MRGSVSEVLEALREEPVRGEAVVVVEGDREGSPVDLDGAVAQARALVAGGTKKREAARRVAAGTALSANAIYRELLGEADG